MVKAKQARSGQSSEGARPPAADASRHVARGIGGCAGRILAISPWRVLIVLCLVCAGAGLAGQHGGTPPAYAGGTTAAAVAAAMPKATNTPKVTATATRTNTATQTATATPTGTATFTPSDTPTNTPTNTPSDTATDTPTNSPTASPTFTPSATPTDTATDTPTDTLTPSPTPTATPVTQDSLLAYWNVDEGTGSTAADASGNNHTLTLFNNPTWTSSGDAAPIAFPNPSALSLDGSTQYATDDGKVDLAGNSFTVAMWVKRARTGVEEYFLSQGQTAATGYELYLGFRSSDVCTCAFYNNDLDTTATTTDFNWHHYACTYDAGTHTRKAYKDGVLIGSDTATPFLSLGPVTIGRRTFTTGFDPMVFGDSYFAGSVDDVRIYGVALSDAAVAALAQGQVVPTPTPGGPTPTATATPAGPCAVTVDLFPPSGIRTPGDMSLDATGSSDGCGLPLSYTWGCLSGTSGGCVTFTNTFDNPPTQPLAYILLNPFNDIEITLHVCELRYPSNCAPLIIREYEGAAG